MNRLDITKDLKTHTAIRQDLEDALKEAHAIRTVLVLAVGYAVVRPEEACALRAWAESIPGFMHAPARGVPADMPALRFVAPS